MKTILKTLGMVAVCLAASLQFCSCSSSGSDGEEEILNQYKYDITGAWATTAADFIRPDEYNKDYAIEIAIPFIEFGKDGKMNWHEWILLEGKPNPTKNHGTYTLKGNELTISAPGHSWLNGTHKIEHMTKEQITLIVENSRWKAQVYMRASIFDL